MLFPRKHPRQKFDKGFAINGKVGAKRRYQKPRLILIANTTLRDLASRGSHGGDYSSSAIVALPVGARLHALSLLWFRLSRPTLCTTDVVLLDLRVPLLRPGCSSRFSSSARR